MLYVIVTHTKSLSSPKVGELYELSDKITIIIIIITIIIIVISNLSNDRSKVSYKKIPSHSAI